MSSSITAAAIIMVVTVSWSPTVSSVHQLNETNDYDRTCFVPPSDRHDTKQFVSTRISYPPLDPGPQEHDFQDYHILAIPNGTCGLDVYYCNFHLWLDPITTQVVEYAFQNIPQQCNTSTQTNWYLKLLTSGNNGHGQESVKLVPDEDLSHLPPDWLQGQNLLLHTDFFPAKQLILHCNIPLLRVVPHSQYNLNVTIELNGCPSGRYGGQCDQTCFCVEGVECHSFNGVCMCPDGLTGTRCEYYNPQLISVQQEQVYVPYGTSYNLTCIADGMIPTNYSWIRESTSTPLVTESREKTVPYEPRPLILTTTVEVLDTTVNGRYICEVYDGNGTIYKQSVSVTVTAVPDPFIQVPQNQTALVDRNVVFTCKTKKVAGAIKWVKGRNPPSLEIKDEVDHYGVHYLPGGVSELHIYGVEFSDEDVYRCYVGYTFKEPDLNYAEAKLIVQSDPRSTCLFTDIIQVVSGHEVALRCQVTEIKPTPSITWFIEGREVTPQPTTITTLSVDQYSFDVNTTMTFVPVPEDDGMRVSVAMESPAWEGIRKVDTSLNVKYKPIVTIDPNPISLASGQDADISCLTKGNPHSTSYTWILRRPDKPPQIDSSTGDTYHLKNIDMTYDLASLTCRAGNEIGDTDDVVQIEVTETGFSSAAIAAFSVSGGLCVLVLVLSSVVAYHFRREVVVWWSAKKDKTKLENKDFDVFISYKSGTPDEEFVVQELIPRLEQDGYRVCVHFRFFLPGRSIIDNISDAVRRSRKTLLLLTPGFVESEWCRYEFQAALLQMLRRQMDIIPVIFEDLGNPENLSEDIQTVLRTLSYITWPNAVLDGQGPQREDNREQFWKLLWETLPDNPLGLEEPIPDLPHGEEGDLELEAVDGDGRALLIV